MDYKESFSKRLVNLREKRGITQQELADKLEITRQSLSLYEKTERTINIELLAKIADFFNVSTDYLMGRTEVASMNVDIQTACRITGLSENSIKMLSQFKNIDHNKNPDRQNRLICPRIKIADYLISEFQFWSYCYDISCTLNYKRLSEESIEKIKETMKIHIDEESRLNLNYSEDEDLYVSDYNEKIVNEEEWFEFKKWELFKHLERISNEIIDNYENFIEKEDTDNANNNPSEE